MSNIVFSSVSESPEVQGIVAQWLWSFWGNTRNYEFYRSLVAHCKADDIPMMYVAYHDGMPVGTVALLRADLFSRQDLFPWMADLYVLPEYRSKGIGSALQDFVLKKAKELGYGTIYLYTPLTGYYEKKGWEYMGNEMERDGEIVRIYKKKIV
ncbi:N-acetyltransferase [Methanocella sp. CWC-04]|uniref:N-acetyltransferase n=1 Tax=Methanooceanicella nereidis TaxID=2052831 RepID=A0AAP2RDE7_9EURY|nr:GNAT family N-acetyltransferase [Methanocella sp. CWC-04]MCD1295534.1 N-acetyltransferase [Methanocella sp. CWC-04]